MVEKSELAPNPTDWWNQMYAPVRQFGQRVADFLSPSADAAMTEDHYEVSVELPGVAEDDITVEIHDGRLTVSGEKRSHREEKGKQFYFSERSYGRFRRVFRLPDDADADKAHAVHKDGLLTVKIAKRDDAAASKRIAVSKG